jgi:RNA polymerase sigma-70 factor (ECF subfamily)
MGETRNLGFGTSAPWKPERMTQADSPSDDRPGIEPWLAAARAGSPEALGKLLEMCRAYLLGVANRELESQLQAKAGASDLVQDAFLEAQRIFSRFQGGSADQLFAWLRAILLNKLADFTRQFRGTEKRQIGREVSLDVAAGESSVHDLPAADTPTPSSVVGRDEQTELLRRVLARLPEHYRQVLVWRQWEDLPFEEIGRRLDRTPAAARQLWMRALERLEEELETPP